MTVNTNYGARPTGTTQKTAAADNTAAIDAQRKSAQDSMKAIEDKAKKGSLTATDRQTYADSVAVDKVLESSKFLGMIGSSSKDKLIKKLEGDIDGFLKANPNATPEQIKQFVTDKFKSNLSSVVVGKSVVDMAIKQMQDRLAELQEDGFGK